MAEAKKTVTMDVGPTELLKVIEDYESYPKFVDGMKNAKVLERKESGGKNYVRVAYTLEILSKEMQYVLDHVRSSGGLEWSLVESNFMKVNSGKWILEPKGTQKTDVTYELNLDFKIPVPSFMLSGLVKSSLPSMLSAFEKRAKKIGVGS